MSSVLVIWCATRGTSRGRRLEHGQRARGAQSKAWAARCSVPADAVAAIKANIERIWNGHRYYCYDIVVRVDVESEPNPDTPDPSDRVRVRIDNSPVAIRSFVSATERTGADWKGNTPGDALTAVNDGVASSTWAWPPGEYGRNLYAHETGHILGIHDTYDDYVDTDGETYSRPKTGAPVDIMNDTQTNTVDAATLQRLGERAGFKKTDLKCNYVLNVPTPGGKITGKKCDAPGGTWTAKGHYKLQGNKGDQVWVVEINASAATGTLTGTFTLKVTQVTKVAGVTVYVKGTASGIAELEIDDQLQAHMHLHELKHKFKATSSQGGKGSDSNAPLETIDHVWEPIGRCR